MEEFGYNREAGFVWLIQKKKKDHVFKKIKRAVSYAPEVTAFVEKYKLKKMTGVKTKELLHWLSVVELYLTNDGDESNTSNDVFYVYFDLAIATNESIF
ncbi:hypothetical protein HPP92_026355 [Vanilla planifolia]|uniref:Uncharacterized protein n=1 Tax=Vanilla planifolia TaxID=51239 RepID=A0A835PFY4_VANPL|nr:hypothetical protein HPP92_026355 [Vanilla planifolia]